MVNAVTAIMEYAMPLVDDLLTDMEGYLWFCLLDAASGFRAIMMSSRARNVSAFVCALGHFEWLRMPFSLKNAPMIYQRMIDNALRRSFVDDICFGSETFEGCLDTLPVFGRRSFVDDICFGRETFEGCLSILDRLLQRFTECRISVSFKKSIFVHPRVDFLSHTVSPDGIQADVKKMNSVAELPFPKTKKCIQSFLGALNYYSRFVQDFTVYAAALYQVKDEDFGGGENLNAAKRSFTILQQKVVEAPILRHFDRAKPVYVTLFANEWALSSTLLQKHDEKLHPVRFCGRVLKDAEMNYHPAEKEVLALLLLLKACYTQLVGRTIHVYTRFSTLDWVIQLSWRRQLYSDKAKIVNVDPYLRIQAGELVELPLRLRSSIHDKLGVTRRTKYISITNIGDEVLILHQDQRIGIWLAGDHVPRIPGFISIGSRRYMEWKNLALEATTDARSGDMEIKIPVAPAVERSEDETPRVILQRPKTTSIQCRKVEAGQDQDISDCLPSDKSPSETRPLDLASVANEESDLSSIADEDSISHVVTVKEALENLDQVTPGVWINQARRIWTSAGTQINITMNVCTTMKDAIYVDGQMAVLPEVPVTTEDVKIEDIQLYASDSQTPGEIDRLRQRIWKFRHLLIGKGNALPPAARGVVCDIDVGGARPIALKCRKLRIPITVGSPIVVIIKKNGVDIKLCIDYRLVNSLTQLMIYPMPLINDLLEDLESTL
ncbi:reverse transcriptase [Phytophthora megakarya]|uniref:Reverse transcriptase n=1 Tax=Phytophthora megakarya TaxID=4795 RepID=A0A225VZ51_9STRA|nr:reverse transcriptase [Phytophthora megakarya]